MRKGQGVQLSHHGRSVAHASLPLTMAAAQISEEFPKLIIETVIDAA